MSIDNELERDEPGAPPGFLLDRADKRTHIKIEVDVEIDRVPGGDLAQGAGETEDDDAA
jgi:hypothetical protein